MSFKITKKRTIQAWLEETIRLINITLIGKEIPIDITKLPPPLAERIAIHTEKQGYRLSAARREALARLLED